MWDIRYRPLKFADVLGQDGTVQVLKSRLRKGTATDTSYIFSGFHGSGKTTLARILARALLCKNLEDGEPCNVCENCKGMLSESFPGFVELDAASKGTVDYARKIVEDLPYVLPGVPKRVYLFDEIHRATRDFQDVLLKPIEDKRLVGIFATTEPEKIRGPIRSRCETYEIRRITREDILGRLKFILEQEGATYEEDALLILIDHSGGHVRDAINSLERLAQLGTITKDSVREQLNLSSVVLFYQVLLSLGDPSKSVPLAETACDRVGVEAVYEGLAEAAMNSYRLAHNLFADFSFADKELALEVSKVYGDSATKLAEHFLRSFRSTKIGLLCDILACAGGVPTTQEVSKVLVQVAASPVPQAIPAPTTILPPAPTPVSTTPQVASKPPPSDLPPKADVQRLTSMDDKVRGTLMPRGAENRAVVRNTERLLSAEEWQTKFMAYMRKLRDRIPAGSPL